MWIGWDKLLVLVSPQLKKLLEGPPPSSAALRHFGQKGYPKEQTPPTVTCVQMSSHRPAEQHKLQIKVLN